MKVAVVGTGSLGTALALTCLRHGIGLAAVWSRSAGGANEAARMIGYPVASGRLPPLGSADMVVLAVRDEAIPEMAGLLVRRLGEDVRPATPVLHCSGALPSALLAEAGVAAPGSFHPLMSFPGRRPVEIPAGVFVGIEGCDAARQAGEGLCRICGLVPVPIDSGCKPLYHAGAVFASNFLVGLLAAAADLFIRAGIPDAASRAMAGRLACGTLDNIVRDGPAAALTGPVARGEAATLALHLAALDRDDPVRAAVYRLLSAELLPLAGGRGGDPAALSAIREALGDG